MKRMKIFLMVGVCVIIVFLIGKQYVDAHPGRTDSSGCHTCRTNCASWGLRQGEYHCHNGGNNSSSSNNSNNSSVNKSVTPTSPKVPEVDYAAKGKTDGYAFKYDNPDAVMPSLEGQNTNYIEAYKESFNQACVELTTASEKLAIENATKDAVSTEECNTDITGLKVISEVYITKYKDVYEQKETDMFVEIEENAKEKAKDDALNLKEPFDENNTYTLLKAKKYYKEQYNKMYVSQKELMEELQEEIKEEAFNLGKNGEDKDYSIIEGYKDYVIYNSLKEIIDKNYEDGTEEKQESTAYGVIGLTVIVGGGYIYYKKRKAKKI